jgi:hypothetical protein
MKNKINDIVKQVVLSEIISVRTIDDFVGLLNKTYNAKYSNNSNPKIISKKQLIYFAHNTNTSYNIFAIKKKSGKLRYISAPVKSLKIIQELISEILYACASIDDCACGFVRERNVATGAKVHVGKNYVFNIDLKDFFDSFEQYQVHRLLNNLFSRYINSDQLNSITNLIAYLCCCQKEVERKEGDFFIRVKRYVLPQGAPSSPILTNLLCGWLDKRLNGLAKKYDAQYSRYADDITFSHSKNIFIEDSGFRTQVQAIIEATPNLYINPQKTRLQGRRYRQEVTGLVVNDKVNIPKRYTNQIRKWLYYWEHYGYQRANTYFVEYYMEDRGYLRKSKPELDNVLKGKLNYLRMIKGHDNSTYQHLNSRYERLKCLDTATILDTQHADTNNITIYEVIKTLIDVI